MRAGNDKLISSGHAYLETVSFLRLRITFCQQTLATLDKSLVIGKIPRLEFMYDTSDISRAEIKIIGAAAQPHGVHMVIYCWRCGNLWRIEVVGN